MDIAPLEQLSAKALESDAHLFEVKPVTLLKSEKRPEPTAKAAPILKGSFAAKNPPPGIAVSFLTGAKGAGKVAVTCKDSRGNQTGIYLGKGSAGLDSTVFDVKEPGEYTITLKAGEATQERKVTVKQDPKAVKTDE